MIRRDRRISVFRRPLLAAAVFAAGLLCLRASAAASTAAAAEQEPAYDHAATELEAGRAYLRSLDERTPAEMEVMIDEARKAYVEWQKLAAYAAQREEYRQTLDGDRVWEAFDDFVFLGDSRVVGFNVFGFLPSERVLAEAGDTINAITEKMDTIRSLSPGHIFISYGINDIGIGFWPTAEDYRKGMEEKLDALQKELPDARIYVNSILPAREDVLSAYPVWAGLPEYSEALRDLCSEKGICFIDNSGIMEEHSDLYADDGVHMQPGFYRFWAENQLLAVYDLEHGRLTFSQRDLTEDSIGK